MPSIHFLYAAALAALAVPAAASDRPVGKRPVMVSSGELAEGFRDRAHCEAVLRGPRGAKPKRAGSLFNRAHGNVSRCENVAGEYQIVVIPRS